MNIPEHLKTALGKEVMQIIYDIDLLIDTYSQKGSQQISINVRSREWDKLNKALEKKGYNLNEHTWRGVKLIRTFKPRRHNKRKLREFEAL